MKIQRFTGATSREALGKARMAFGEGTLILSNRPTASGVEVMATGEEGVYGIDTRDAPIEPAPAAVPASILKAAAAPPAMAKSVAPEASVITPSASQRVEEDTEQLTMSTLSFQDYVRERMLRRRQSESPAHVDEPATKPVLDLGPRVLAPAASARTTAARPVAREAAAATHSIAHELQSMRDLIEDRFNTFAWLGQAKQHPIQSNLMLKLIRAGYSPLLARTILEHMPDPLTAPEAIQWMMEAIERNIKTSSVALHEEGGSYALIGATGVGKTTTVAKLAGQCAKVHGASSVGMITLDTHRVGGHEQLREHGRSMGIVAHLAHDRAALQDLLGLLSNKKMVLVDTTGLAPRDPGKDDSLGVLDLPGVKRLLVLNAGTHGDTLDEAVAAFKSGGVQHAILSKLDEAVKLGPALDVAVRHQLLLRGVTTGQKVPQDLALADGTDLVSQSMRAIGKSAFDPKTADLGFFFIQPDNRSYSSGRANA